MLVRPEGRTLQSKKPTSAALIAFQCSSAPKDGRYAQSPPLGHPIVPQVSMLVRPEGRTLRFPTQRFQRSSKAQFQCSSAPKDGRYFVFSVAVIIFISFNARPPRRTDATITAWCGDIHHVVSMLVRPEGRTLHRCRCGTTLDKVVSMLVRPEGRTLLIQLGGYEVRLLFQCSSAPKDGRYVSHPCPTRSQVQVSMLVRPEGRTLPSKRGKIKGYVTSFNARPPRRTDATIFALNTERLCWSFQCSSAPKDGRY